MFKRIPTILVALASLTLVMTFSSACSDDTEQPVKQDTGVADKGSGDITVQNDGPSDDMKQGDGLVNVDMKQGDGLVNVDMKQGDGPVAGDGPLGDVLPPVDLTPDQPYTPPSSSKSPWKFQQGWRIP